MISNCSIDERGKATGGKAGDQTGKEWRVRSWYNYPWNVVLHHPNAAVRSKMAELARAAANNDCIGYDQYQRTTFWIELQKVNYNPAAIKTNCESDCSAGVAAIVKAVGYLLNDEKLKQVNINAYTGNLKAALKAAGFEVLTASKYLNSDKYLYAGDVLLKEGRHTAINLDNGACVASVSLAIGAKPTVKDWQIAAIADGFKFPEYGADGLWGRECEAVAKKAIIKKRVINRYPNLTKLVQRYLCVAIDGKCGTETANAIKAYQQKNGLTADGECGLMTWRKMLT